MAKETDNSQKPINTLIEVEGCLTQQWSDWFEGLTIIPEADGKTLITGYIEDQAGLYGLLKKIRDLGLPLISVNQAVVHKKTIQGEKNEQ